MNRRETQDWYPLSLSRQLEDLGHQLSRLASRLGQRTKREVGKYEDSSVDSGMRCKENDIVSSVLVLDLLCCYDITQVRSFYTPLCKISEILKIDLFFLVCRSFDVLSSLSFRFMTSRICIP